jgi:hypothetical protein
MAKRNWEVVIAVYNGFGWIGNEVATVQAGTRTQAFRLVDETIAGNFDTRWVSADRGEIVLG